jgi:hypothetical protein
MTASYTFDVVSTLDGYGSYDGGNWGGYWGKQAVTPSTSSPGSKRSPRCRCAHTAAWR